MMSASLALQKGQSRLGMVRLALATVNPAQRSVLQRERDRLHLTPAAALVGTSAV